MKIPANNQVLFKITLKILPEFSRMAHRNICFQLYGHYDDGQWEEGLLTKLLQRSHDQVLAAEWCARNLDEKRGGKTPAQPPAPIHKWLVLDGSLNPVWAEGLHTLMDNTRKLYTADGGHVSLHCECWTKWLTFCRQHFQMQFLDRKLLYLASDFAEFLFVKIQLTLVQVIACRL